MLLLLLLSDLLSRPSRSRIWLIQSISFFAKLFRIFANASPMIIILLLLDLAVYCLDNSLIEVKKNDRVCYVMFYQRILFKIIH